MANTTEITAEQETSVTEKPEQLAQSERFTSMVLKEFGGNVSGAMQVTDYQKALIQGYFIAIDQALKKAEEDRQKKNKNNSDHKYDEMVPVTWKNVNLNDLAMDLVHYARMGLDMTQDNMLFPIPYKNNKRSNYDITLMEGYNGIRYIGKKYAVEPPVATAVEVVYSTDTFKPIKKGKDNNVESYEFVINNPFDRGEIIGAFAYHEFEDPAKNELIIMSMKDILKRKPKYASANFWGGTQKVWKDGKRVEEETEGWLDEMVRKTIIREAFSAKHLPRDPRKVDDDYQYMRLREAHYAEVEAQAEIDANANVTAIDTAPVQSLPAPQNTVDTLTGEIHAAETAAPATEAFTSEPDF